jgi:hypothetical protein
MAAEIGEGRRCRQSKIDFISSALAVLPFSNRAAALGAVCRGLGSEIMVDNRRVLT